MAGRLCTVWPVLAKQPVALCYGIADSVELLRFRFLLGPGARKDLYGSDGT